MVTSAQSIIIKVSHTHIDSTYTKDIKVKRPIFNVLIKVYSIISLPDHKKLHMHLNL